MPSHEITLSKGTIFLRGEVSYQTAGDLSVTLPELMQLKAQTLDCSGVTQMDSAIVAMLLVALGLAKKLGVDFKIVGLPETAVSLINLYDLDELFACALPLTKNPLM